LLRLIEGRFKNQH
jgi:Ras-related protein Rab-2A